MIPLMLTLPQIKHLQEGKSFRTFKNEGDTFTPALYIPGIDHRYVADIFGNIWSNMSPGGTGQPKLRQLAGSFVNKNWLAVYPKIGNSYPCKMIHQLVASAFYKKPSNYTFVQHLDGNNLNNQPSNLKWYGSVLNEFIESFQVIVRNNKLVRC